MEEFVCFFYVSMPIHDVLWGVRVGHLNAFKPRTQGNSEMRYP